MSQPWYVDVITGALVVFWMGWTYATMQSYGPSLPLVASAVIVGMIGLLAIHGQYVTYVRLGNSIVIGREPPGRQRAEESDDRDRPRNR